MGGRMGRGPGSSAVESPDCDSDCATAVLVARATKIKATKAGMTARERSRNIRDDVDDETDDRRNEKKREDRMDKGDAAYPHRGDGDIRRLIAYGNRKRIIHKIPEVRRRALGKLEPHVISQLAVDDMVVVVEAHVMKTKIKMG